MHVTYLAIRMEEMGAILANTTFFWVNCVSDKGGATAAAILLCNFLKSKLLLMMLCSCLKH